MRTLTLEEVAASRRRSRALAAWADLQTLRTVTRSIANGVGQDVIARALAISQPAVSKLARRARVSQCLEVRTPREVILERAVGLIDTGAMLQELRAWHYSPGRFGDGVAVLPESYLPGLRGQIEDAAAEGLLTREEFARIVRHE